jgi:uncharacterized protein (TIGR00251 family)
MTGPFTPCDGGLLVSVRLTPRGGRDAIDGIERLSDGRTVLKARVRAIPEDGAANAALMKLLARTCDCPTSAISFVSGATSRIKTVRIAGENSLLEARLQAESKS